MAFDHEGRYEGVTVKGAYLDVSANKGTPFARVTFVADEDGDNISKDIWLTENNREGASRALKAIGFEVGKDDFTKIEELVAGHVCSLTLGNNDRGELEVKWVNAPRATTGKSVAEMANDLFGTKKATTTKKKPVAHANPPGEDDDSVPF